MTFDLGFQPPVPDDFKPPRRRFNAFVSVKPSWVEAERSTILNRHQERLEHRSVPARPLSVYVPISDMTIIAGLRQSIFPHPYALLGILERWKPPSDEEISNRLLPFHLHIDPSQRQQAALIPQLADLYQLPPDQFLMSFKNSINADVIRQSWRAVFTAVGVKSEQQLDQQIRARLEKCVMRFPSVAWTLKSMDDLYCLHVLACAMNTQIFLILARSSVSQRKKDKEGKKQVRMSFLPANIFSLQIGPQRAKFSLFIVVKAFDDFYIAEPQVRAKCCARKSFHLRAI